MDLNRIYYLQERFWIMWRRLEWGFSKIEKFKLKKNYEKEVVENNIAGRGCYLN